MNADPNPQPERPPLDSLALFRATPNGHSTARPGRVRSTFRLDPGADRPGIRLVVSVVIGGPDGIDAAVPPTAP